MSTLQTTEVRIPLDDRPDGISGLLTIPKKPGAVYVFAHGAGAGMRHAFMNTVTELLVNRDVAVLRYQFPYMDDGRRAPNPPRVLIATVAQALEFAREKFPSHPLFLGGKSMGGRMSSMCAAQSKTAGVAGLIFFGFPLHAAGKPSSARGDHLREVKVPMLFVQGSRDRLADINLLRAALRNTGGASTLLEVEDGDHSLRVPKRSGRSNEQALTEVTGMVVEWITQQGWKPLVIEK